MWDKARSNGFDANPQRAIEAQKEWVKSKKRKKTFQETLDAMLALPTSKEFEEAIKEKFVVDWALTNQDAMCLVQIKKAIEDADTQAFNSVTDRADWKAVQPIENTENIKVQIQEDKQEKLRKLIKERKKEWT